jgi:transcriptional regulator with XRE-family HTH domain
VLAVAEDAVAKAARRVRLAQRRKALGLTQEDLAGLLDIDRSTVVRWERGESEPLPWIRHKLATALQVTADRLEELLAISGVPARPGGAAPDVPRQLPPAVAGFTGRSAELDALTALLDRPAGQAPEAVVISAIGGTAGVGKTALAVQWAHQVADRFPGGQLYVNLRGYDQDRPMPAGDALAGFLRALGVPGQEIPLDADERASRYRSLLAGKKLLVVLDNAGSVEQVWPLLPGSASCAVVVTSRDALAGLVARHGATRLELDLLPAEDAVGLLRELIGRRVNDDPGAAGMLAAQCCRLPLALRVAAELAAARPDVPLAELAGELADQQQRLDLLDAGGDPRTAVRAVFSWSYRHLDPAAARAFRLAGLHPGPDFDPTRSPRSPAPVSRKPAGCWTHWPARTWSSPRGRAGTAYMTCCAPMPANSPTPATAKRNRTRR